MVRRILDMNDFSNRFQKNLFSSRRRDVSQKKGEAAVIMIAGGSGFLGYNVARCLADRGEEVLLVQRHPVQTPPLLESYWEREVRQAAGDITDLSVLLGLAKAYSVESIIHAAHATAGAPKGSKYEVPLDRMHYRG